MNRRPKRVPEVDLEIMRGRALGERNVTPADREIIERVYIDWDRFNRDHFDGGLATLLIRIVQRPFFSPPGRGPVAACYISRSFRCGVDLYDGDCQIHIPPCAHEIHLARDLLTGVADPWQLGPEAILGRRRLTADLLLHEMIHQYVDDVLELPDGEGHGISFTEKCNQLSAQLRLPMVEPANGSDGDNTNLGEMPLIAAYWPQCVRPDPHAYYSAKRCESGKRARD